MFPARHADFDFQLALNRNILDLVSLDPIRFLGSNRQGRMFSYDLEELRKTHAIRTAPEVWDTLASFGVFDSDQHTTDILKLRALRLRSQYFIELLRDSLGTDALAPIVVDLTNSFRGKNFLFEEFVDVFSDHGVVLEELAGDLIRTAELPGFVATDPNIQQSTGSGRTSYESSFVLQNDQPTSGPVQLSIAYQSEDPFIGSWNAVSLPPILVGANQHVRVVIESPNPVQSIWVKPYVSLNRTKFRIDLPLSDEMQSHEVNTEDAPFIKEIEIVEVEQRPKASITIDDLDPEFSVVDHHNTSVLSSAFTQFFRRLLGTEEVQLDSGLPVYRHNYRGMPVEWSRQADPSAYGTYRRTFVLSKDSERAASAKFSATLPRVGTWKLEYYLPDQFLVEEIRLGGMSTVALLISHSVSTINLEIHDGEARVSHLLDTSNLPKGWHTIGNFDLSYSEVDVLVLNKTDQRHNSVIADAIRWTPVE